MNVDSLYAHFLAHPWISTDSRKIIPGCLFFALSGEHYDGNQFAASALQQGASLAVVSDPALEGPSYYHVTDTLKALQQLAQHHRQQLSIPVIGITGSNGKTTTKELLAAVLRHKYKVQATTGNLNNHIGVPLTVLSVQAEHEILICEMGANHIGEIRQLCEIARPTHGLITNIGKAHLEGFGSYEGVKQAKGELYEYVDQHDGLLFVNGDDPALAELSKSLKRKISYGLNADIHVDVHFQYEPSSDLQGFRIFSRNGSVTITSTMFGQYNAMNVLAAYCVGTHFGIGQKEINNAISGFVPSGNRSEIITWKGNTVVKDAYNANPSSMEMALRSFGGRYPAGWVVLGDMKELGDQCVALHRDILHLLPEWNFEKVFLVGTDFRRAASLEGIANAAYQFFDSIDELRLHWDWNQIRGKEILLKGSRSMQLERLLE
jgi:UDP-N-acetylmuramoyl-tripeptide--D-alanyl-D-alanine ligase